MTINAGGAGRKFKPPMGAPTARVALTELTFSGGKKVPVPQNAVLVIVGPNNSGKSVALQNINAAIRGQGSRTVVCTPAFSRTGSPEDLKKQMAPYLGRVNDNPNDDRYQGPNFEVAPNNAES